MAFNIFNLIAIFALLLAICTATPISSSTCVMPTVTTDGNKLIGYAQATATPGLANYFPLHEFSDHHMIEGAAYHPNLVDRSLAEWACQYSCGENCFAFFVFWDTTVGKDPHFECRVYTTAFAKPDLAQSPKKEWTRGQAFNKQCFDPAMKFKRVPAAADIELSTGGWWDPVAVSTSAGLYPTVLSTKTLPATKTITIQLKSVAKSIATSTGVPTNFIWTSTTLTTITLTTTSSSTFSHIPPPLSTTPTASTAPTSTCSRSSFVADGATVTGFSPAPAPAPTISTANYDVDPAFSSSYLVAQLYLAVDKSLGEVISMCAEVCNAHPECIAFIVTEGEYSMSPSQHAAAVLRAQMADFRAVKTLDGSVSLTCDLYKHALQAGHLVVAPENERAIAAFNDMCPAKSA